MIEKPQILTHEERKVQEPPQLPETDKAINGVSDDQNHQRTNPPTPELTYVYYQEIRDRLKIPENPDFSETRDGKINCAFHEITDRAYRLTIAGKKTDVTRRLGEHTKLNAVYIPPELRTEEPDLIGNTLYLVQSEIDAWVLSSMQFPAIGLPRPNSFLSRPTQLSPHKLINQALQKLGLTNIAYIGTPAFEHLPEGSDKKNPYEFINAAKFAEIAVTICAALEKTFPQIPVSMYMHPQHKSVLDSTFQTDWLEEWTRIPISSGTNHSWKHAFHIDSVDHFYQWHQGPSVLGYIFQMGKNVYEYDPRTGILDIVNNSNDCFSVIERQGRYWSVMPWGEDPISNFLMTFDLEVKQENSFFLITFQPLRGAKQTATINVQDLIKADAFKSRVIDIPGSKFSYWGSKPHLEQIVAMSRTNVPEAISLESHLGYHKKSGLFVYGNGILREDGVFVDVDETGVAAAGSQQYYLPGFASFNEDRASEFRDERQFQYLASSVEFVDWCQLFIQVHGNPGHMALAFLFASVYLDIYREEGFQVFPHFSLFAPPESGKTSIVNSLSRFFGDLTQSNLRAGVTHASFDRKIEKYHNALIVLNEFNLSNPKVQKMSLEEYLVGVYDDQAREKTVNNRSKQAKPNSSIITVGQEAFYHRKPWPVDA